MEYFHSCLPLVYHSAPGIIIYGANKVQRIAIAQAETDPLVLAGCHYFTDILEMGQPKYVTPTYFGILLFS